MIMRAGLNDATIGANHVSDSQSRIASVSVSDSLRVVHLELFAYDDLRQKLQDQQAHSGNHNTRFLSWPSSGTSQLSSYCSCDEYRSPEMIGMVRSRGRQELLQPHGQRCRRNAFNTNLDEHSDPLLRSKSRPPRTHSCHSRLLASPY